MGSLRFLETSRGDAQLESDGGELLVMDRLSSSEQRDPLRDESVERAGLGAEFRLKKLPNCAAAVFMSVFRVLLLLLLKLVVLLFGGKAHCALGAGVLPPNIGSCFTVPGLFFSWGETGAERSSSRAWMK